MSNYVYTYQTILGNARTIKNKAEKEHEKIGAGWSYYIAKAILKPKNDIKKITVKGASGSTGNDFSRQIKQSEYKDMAERFIKYVEKNEKLPNYISIGNKKMRVSDYTLMFANILIKYDKDGKLPSEITVNSNVYNKTTKKKYGHSKEHCCDDMGQNTGYYCGCHSLQEVFRNLTGKVIPQKTIASICGTTTSGTDHNGLNTCVAWFNRKYGFNLKVQWYNFSDLGWNGIRKIINSNNQDCIIHNLYRNQWGHYEVINKVYDNYCEVQNSLGNTCSNGCYYGYVEERSLSTFRSYINGISQKSVMVITNE